MMLPSGHHVAALMDVMALPMEKCVLHTRLAYACEGCCVHVSAYACMGELCRVRLTLVLRPAHIGMQGPRADLGLLRRIDVGACSCRCGWVSMQVLFRTLAVVGAGVSDYTLSTVYLAIYQNNTPTLYK